MNKTLGEHLLDAIFPPACISCNEPGSFFCEACASRLVPIKLPICFFCGQLTDHFETCPACRSKVELTGVVPVFYYNDLAKDLIAQFKYYDFAVLGKWMAEQMAGNISRFPELVRRLDAVSFVPLHFWRQAYRGYNQAALLAAGLSRLLNKPILKGLIRTKSTKAQAKLSRLERQRNMEEAFAWRGGEINGKNILLVDDVATSGTTINEAAKVLRRAGAREIWGAVFAKG
jgi:ComF family protein